VSTHANSLAALRARVERLELQNRLEREKSTLLTVELDETKEELAELKAEQPKPKAQKADHQSDHPSVKPVLLMEDVCTLVCPGGGRILDPFAGTGSTGVAARNKNFDCVLIEQDATMRPVIEDRVRR